MFRYHHKIPTKIYSHIDFMVNKSQIQIRFKKKLLINPNQILKQCVEMTSSKEEAHLFFVGVIKVVLPI